MINQELFDIDKTPHMIKEAISFIKSNLSNKGEIFVGFSGGKDSIVVAELLKMSKVKHQLYYSFTGLDAPEVIKFIRKNYPECIFLKPKRTFWDLLSVNVVPSDRIRWCCRTQKKEAGWKLPHKFRIMGIRAEEGAKRSSYKRINYFEKLDHYHYYPILNWKEYHVWDFIELKKLKVPILYEWGFNRIGCVVCPYHSEKTGQLHKKYRSHWPKFFDRFEKGVIELYKKRVSQGKIMNYSTAEEYLKAWFLDDSSRWYKK